MARTPWGPGFRVEHGHDNAARCSLGPVNGASVQDSPARQQCTGPFISPANIAHMGKSPHFPAVFPATHADTGHQTAEHRTSSRCWGVSSEEILRFGDRDGRTAGGHAELGEDGGDVLGGRAAGDEQVAGDLLV
jgi:hypothetical protein